MNMQIFAISRTHACVSGNIQETQAIHNLHSLSNIRACQIKSDLSYRRQREFVLMTLLCTEMCTFYSSTPRTRTVALVYRRKSKIYLETIAPIGANPGIDSQWGLMFSFQPLLSNHYHRFLKKKIPRVFNKAYPLLEQNRSLGCSAALLWREFGLADHWSIGTETSSSQHGISDVHSDKWPGGFSPATGFRPSYPVQHFSGPF